MYTKNSLIDIYCWQDRLLSEDEELPLGSEAAINEDVFDLEDLEEDEELNADRAASQASLASSFVSALQEVREKKFFCLGFPIAGEEILSSNTMLSLRVSLKNFLVFYLQKGVG